MKVNMDLLGEPETPEEAMLGCEMSLNLKDDMVVRATKNGWIRIVVHKGNRP